MKLIISPSSWFTFDAGHPNYGHQNYHRCYYCRCHDHLPCWLSCIFQIFPSGVGLQGSSIEGGPLSSSLIQVGLGPLQCHWTMRGCFHKLLEASERGVCISAERSHMFRLMNGSGHPVVHAQTLQ